MGLHVLIFITDNSTMREVIVTPGSLEDVMLLTRISEMADTQIGVAFQMVTTYFPVPTTKEMVGTMLLLRLVAISFVMMSWGTKN